MSVNYAIATQKTAKDELNLICTMLNLRNLLAIGLVVFLCFAGSGSTSFFRYRHPFGFGLYNRRSWPRVLNANYWINTLNLTENIEGGFFSEVYRNDESTADLPQRYGKTTRSFGTSIYYLLRDHDFSTFHVLASDEQWHFYYGRPLNIYVIDPETKDLRIATLGPRENNHFFYNVPHGQIFAARLKNPRRGAYALVGATVSPGFEFDDYSQPNRSELIRRFPKHRELIRQLTVF